MGEALNLPAVILAGGQSRRFGRPKGLAAINGVQMIKIIIKRLHSQTAGPVVINTALDGPYSHLGLPIRPDFYDTPKGPLAGIHAAMQWAAEMKVKHVVTCPVDVPLLPPNLLLSLKDLGAPAICSSRGRLHPVIGIWPSKLASDLDTFIRQGHRSTHAWVDHCGAKCIDFPDDSAGRDPFFNVNSPNDLPAASTAENMTINRSSTGLR